MHTSCRWELEITVHPSHRRKQDIEGKISLVTEPKLTKTKKMNLSSDSPLYLNSNMTHMMNDSLFSTLIHCPKYIEDYLVCNHTCLTINGNNTCNVTPDPLLDAEFRENLHTEKIVRLIVPALFGLIVILGLIGNILVIAVVWSNKQMQNTTNILIVSLAFADLFFIVFCVPFTAAAYATTVYPFGSIWCKFSQYMIHVCAYASVWTLVLMSFDRYLAVVHPIASMRIRNRKNTYCLLFLIWFIICAGHTPLLFHFGVAEYNFYIQRRSGCIDIKGTEDNKFSQIFFSCFFAFGYVLPLALICILYGFLLKRLLYGVVPGGSQRAESIRSKKRVTRMVIIVVVIFAVCWLPIQLILLIQSFNKYKIVSIQSFSIALAANCLAYMNSCVNPILYAFLSENFRRSFRRLLCCMSEPYSKFEYERTNIRGIERDTKESLLNNTSKLNGESKDKNCNSENVLQMKTLNKSKENKE